MKQNQKRNAKSRAAKSVLRLPDLEVAKSAVAFQVAAPDWTDNQRLDIQAVVPTGATKEQFEAMLQNQARNPGAVRL